MGSCCSSSTSKPQTKSSDTEPTVSISPNSLGNKAYGRKDWVSAQRHYTEAIESKPGGPKTHLYLVNRAIVYNKLEKYDECIADLKLSIALNSNYLKAWKQLAQIYLCKTQDNES